MTRQRGDLLLDDAGNVVGVSTAPPPPRKHKPRRPTPKPQPDPGPNLGPGWTEVVPTRPVTVGQAEEVEWYLSPGGLSAADVLALPVDYQWQLLCEARQCERKTNRPRVGYVPTADDFAAVQAEVCERELAAAGESERRRKRRLRLKKKRWNLLNLYGTDDPQTIASIRIAAERQYREHILADTPQAVERLLRTKPR